MRTFTAALALAASALLAACSADPAPAPSVDPPASTAASSAPSTPSPKTATPEALLEQAVRDYSTAFLTGDGKAAFELVSKRCQAETSLSEYGAMTGQAAELYGDLEIKTLDVTVNGDRASVTYTYPVSTLDQQDQRWDLEGDQWKWSGC